MHIPPVQCTRQRTGQTKRNEKNQKKRKEKKENLFQNSQQIRKHNHVPKRLRHPHQIERILLHAHPLRQRSRIIAAQPAAAVRIHADTKVADADFETGAADDVGNGRDDVGVDLGRAVGWCVGGVVEGDEEDVGDAGGGGGGAC